MGFLDFLFKPKEELPEIKPTYVEKLDDNRYISGIDPLPIKYSDKGVSQIKSGKWRAFINIPSKKDNKVKYTQVHIGYYDTKEEAQEARYHYIEKLK